MGSPFNFIFFVFILITAMSCHKTEDHSQPQDLSKLEIEEALIKLMDTWYPRIVDTVNGGYWTNFEYNWEKSEEQPKMLVSQSRGLWTAARAAQAFPGQKKFEQAAHHGFNYLIDHLWDSQNGGFFQYDYRFSPQPDLAHKLTYGNAFALYALSEYAKINPSDEAVDWVRKAFDSLTKLAYDPTYHGYYKLILDESIRNNPDTATQAAIEKLGWGQSDWKDQNTSIHLLEALTNAYQVLPTEPVREKLETMLRLVRDTMVNEEGYLHLYFTRTWEPIVHRDSSRQFILDNIRYDHRSFGHDIETAFLLIEAAEVLYGEVDPLTLKVANKMMEHTLAYGFDEDYYGIFDKGYQFSNSEDIEVVSHEKVWWSQAEAFHALALFHKLYPEDDHYRQGKVKMWAYLENEMIDHEHGGWYPYGLDENPESKTMRKAHQWKTAYHNGRALMQVAEYFKDGH